MMKILLAFFLTCIIAWNATAQQNAASIKQQMSAIRKSTNWEDPVVAKKANEQIKELSKKLMMTGNPQGLPKDLSKSEAGQAKKDAVDEKSKLWGQIMKSAAGGESADILLAEPVREEIKEEYRDDEAVGINPAILSESTILILDFSLPVTQLLVSQMELFRSIQTLIIIGVESTAPVDLNSILDKAKKYPLSELYIIGFQDKLKNVPTKVTQFPDLNTLGLYCNQLSVLPSNLIQLFKLKALYIDYNPIKTLQPINNLVKKLEVLSINKTEISVSEIAALNKMFPDCKIQTE